MASFNVTTRLGKFFGLQKFQLVQGEEAVVDLIDHAGEHRWVSYNDKVLEIDDKPFTTKIKGLIVGETELQIQDMTRKTLYFIPVEIIEGMPEMAVDLGAKVETRTKTA